MRHLVLLGDSIFDNAAYTEGGPDVVTQARQVLPDDWHATLRAVDGATTADVAGQLHRLPRDASHLVLSVGGNDVLGQSGVLDLRVSSTAQALERLAEVVAPFAAAYRAAVSTCLRPGLPLALCTIYDGCFPDGRFQRVASTALTAFNDAILRTAVAHRLDVIDLRTIFALPEDYANPIEPSSVGGEKLVRAIAAWATGATAVGLATRLFGP